VEPPEDENQGQPPDNTHDDASVSPDNDTPGTPDEETPATGDEGSTSSDSPGSEDAEGIPLYQDSEDTASPAATAEDAEGIPLYQDSEDAASPAATAEDAEGIPLYQDSEDTASPAATAEDAEGIPLYPDADSSLLPGYAADDTSPFFGYIDDDEPDQTRSGGPFGNGMSQDTLLLLIILIGAIFFIASTIIFTNRSEQVSTPGDDATTTATAATTYPPPGTAGVPTRVAEATPSATPTSRQPGITGVPEPGEPTSTGGTTTPAYPGDDDRTQVAIAPTSPDDPYPGESYPGQTPARTATVPPSPTLIPRPTNTIAPPPTRLVPTREVPPTQAPPPTRPPIEPTIPDIVEPTIPPPPTSTPPPTNTPIPTPTEIQEDLIEGEQRWTPAQGPVVLERDVRLVPGSTLIVEPGAEVRLRPGVSIHVDGAQMLVLGKPGRPVRFVAQDYQRWEAIYGLPGSFIALEHAEISGGGSGGTLIASEEGELAISDARISNNGGTVLVTDSKFELRNSELAGNDIPYGGMLNLNYEFGNYVTMINNRIGGNRHSENTAGVDITNVSTFDGVVLDVQGNLIRGGGVMNMRISTNGPMYGTVACNALIGDQLGFGLRTQTLQVPESDLTVSNNFIDEHTPPIVPIYLEYGIGRGATSEIALDMTNNWWGHESGPYHPEENIDGRGDSAGVNIEFEPWLTSPPECAPHQ
jgi:hypothetical protein